MTEKQFVENEKWFNFLLKLPKIILILSICLFFVWGIIDPIVFQYGYKTTHYGIFELESGFLCWFIWVVIGWVVGLLSYVILKMVLSYKVVHIGYLRKMSGIPFDKERDSLISVWKKSLITLSSESKEIEK